MLPMLPTTSRHRLKSSSNYLTRLRLEWVLVFLDTRTCYAIAGVGETFDRLPPTAAFQVPNICDKELSRTRDTFKRPKTPPNCSRLRVAFNLLLPLRNKVLGATRDKKKPLSSETQQGRTSSNASNGALAIEQAIRGTVGPRPVYKHLSCSLTYRRHKSIISYLEANNLPSGAAALRAELGLEADSYDVATTKKYETLLEKKWTSVVRLQKKACHF